MVSNPPKVVYDFDAQSNPRSWSIVDDRVMGGRSLGNIEINSDGHGVFFGDVSLENNGGFSSVRYNPRIEGISSTDKVSIRLKGDGKPYQFRVKQDYRAYYSYIYTFETSGDWQTIEIPLQEMYPSFRGRRLYGENFNHSIIREVAFLIGNKKAQAFKLTIDKIEIVN